MVIEFGGRKGKKMNKSVTQEDKILAALAHSMVILPVIGLPAPVLIWATQKERSSFVRFQTLQATAYQFLEVLGYFLCMGCYMFSTFGMMFLASFLGFAAQGKEPAAGVFPAAPLVLFNLATFAVFALLLLICLAFMGYGLYGAWAALQGRDFRYILIGPRVERYLAQGD